MKAVLVVPPQDETPCPAVPCLCLFPMTDRPFLQHVVEALAGRGVKEIEVVFGRGAAAVERFLGDGTRWGCSISYHLLGDPERCGAVLRAAAADGGPVVVARADQLPHLPDRFPESAVLFGKPGEWSGWAVADAGGQAEFRSAALADLPRFLLERGAAWSGAGRSLVLRSFADVPAAQQAFLRGEVPGALTAAREVRPGVWLARGARVSPASTITPPVFVGENSVVGAGVRLGPFAAVGPDCLLDRDSGVRDSTVCAETYVGPGVELDGVIADGRTLVNPAQRTVATVDGRHLDRLAPSLPVMPALHRLLAAAAFGLAFPVVLAAALWLLLTRRGPVFWPRRFVLAPVSPADPVWELGTAYTLAPPQLDEEKHGWVIPATFRGLVLELLPSLVCVAWGTLRLVGVPPRGRRLLRVHAERCPALLRTPPGLVTEAALCDPQNLSPDDCLVVDAYQTETSDAVGNAGRFARFLVRSLTVWGTPRRVPVPAGASAPVHDATPAAPAVVGVGGVSLEPIVASLRDSGEVPAVGRVAERAAAEAPR